MPAYQPVSARELATVWGARPATVALRDITLLCCHNLNLVDDGIYNKRAQRGASVLKPSTASLHAAGRAWDCGVHQSPKPLDAGLWIAHLMVGAANAIGVCEVIWNHQRWTQAKGWQAYHGVDPHVTHVHIGQTADFVSKNNSRASWLAWYSHFLFGK